MLSCLIILTVVLHTCLSELDLLHPSQPCTKAKDQNAYDTFLHRHLRKDTPTDPRKLREWQKFINKINTWDRPIQSFLPFREAKRVIAVCSSGGKMYEGNLCISKDSLTFFTVEINDRKQVKRVKVGLNVMALYGVWVELLDVFNQLVKVFLYSMSGSLRQAWKVRVKMTKNDSKG
ncbi:hypothetical protein QQF64_009830 [Cirrhinus molitorella]|uniref:Uncharacterized protein n=1 Tax=Cirrhinus molitorella TaxID=172907 RepID=A0ABR3M2A0_9TELE